MSLLSPHWPKEIDHLSCLKYNSSIDPDTLNFIKGRASYYTSNQRPFVVIRKISTPSNHPAYGQYGLFAAKKIPQKTHIIDYLGEVHSDERPQSDYDLSLYRSTDGTVNIGIDAASMGNEARFVNDFRGIRVRPNSVFKESRSGLDGALTMSIWSSEDIKKGEEILVSYGKSWWKERGKGDILDLAMVTDTSI